MTAVEVIIVVAAWLAAGLPLGLLVGGVIRLRDNPPAAARTPERPAAEHPSTVTR